MDEIEKQKIAKEVSGKYEKRINSQDKRIWTAVAKLRYLEEILESQILDSGSVNKENSSDGPVVIDCLSLLGISLMETQPNINPQKEPFFRVLHDST